MKARNTRVPVMMMMMMMMMMMATYCSQQRRPGRVPRFLGANRHRQYTVPLCLGVRDPGVAVLRSIRVV